MPSLVQQDVRTGDAGGPVRDYIASFERAERDFLAEFPVGGEAEPLPPDNTDPSLRLDFIPRHAVRLYWSAMGALGIDIARFETRVARLAAKIWAHRAEKGRSHLLPVAGRSAQLGPRILIDVSSAARFPIATGIQRVVREFAKLAWESGVGLPVVVAQGRAFEAYTTGRSRRPVRPQAGDRLLLLDASWNHADDLAGFVEEVRAAGGLVVPLIYDIIPTIYPECWAKELVADFTCCIDDLLRTADMVLTTSRAVALDLREGRFASLIADKPIGYAHLACDSKTFRPGRRSPEALAACGEGPFFLSVGTIEPRKGLEITLQAFEGLWAEGLPAKLVIVGRTGWNMRHFERRLRDHSEAGRRLHWLNDCSDADLEYAYGQASAVILSSIAEGFGMPVIEAAHFGAPVILSDIRVFREVAIYADATFFSPADPRSLADAVRRHGGRAPAGPDPAQPVPTWRDVVVAIAGMLRSPAFLAASGRIVTWQDCRQERAGEPAAI